MNLLKNGDMVVVALTREKIIELINETIFENINYLSKIDNDISELVISVQYFKANDEFPIVVFAAEDSNCNMMKQNYSEFAEKIIHKNLCEGNIPLYIPQNKIGEL